ncbi:MAG: LL-diaminopimelate aminotransferase [Chloroflexota bacterium]|nr:LL-diaminopimelate aminotransferase [Chloroflexota bacterium]MDQ5864212.1 LL-diaminopimelate aminotransferase [Chloroflexota bacterium]
MKFAKRLDNLPPYVFAGMAKKIADLRSSGIEVINLSMGDPDVPTPGYLLDELCEAARRPENSRYPDYYGKMKLREAIADWYHSRFEVELEPRTEVLPLIGSKEGIANVALAFVDPGDAALVPDPAYPVYRFGTIMADGVICPLPLHAENGWLPDLDALDESLSDRVNVVWLNYPNNPTGATADLEFFERVVAWARRHDVIIAHDNPYSEITFDGYRAPSILEVPGAKDVAVEFNSMSKTYSMAGLRIGMVVGNADIIGALGRIKTNIDSGIYGAVQDAAIAALTGDQSWIPQRNEIYRDRRDKLCKGLSGIGIQIEPPKASLYLWAPVPKGYTSAQFTELMLTQLGVAVTSGASYGKQGEGWFRVSLTVPDADIDEAVGRLPKLQF